MLAPLAAALLAAAGSPPTGPGTTAARVTIERPADADSVLQETTSRLRPELAAAGYASQVATCAVDPLAGPAACPRDNTASTISLARANGTTSIFVTSRLRSGRDLRRQVRVRPEDGGGDATLLAVRAVELLRDLQVEVAQVAEDDEDPKPLEQFKEPPDSRPSRWHLIGGATTLFIPWTNRSAFVPGVGGLLGVGARFGHRVMAVIDAAGPFAMQVPIGVPDFPNGPATPRQLYQAVARLSLRIGRRSPLEGPFATVCAGVGYMTLQLDPLVSTVSTTKFVPALVGLGVGYSTHVTPALAVTADVDLIGAPTLEIQTMDGRPLTRSSAVWLAVNLTAALALP